MRNIIDPTRLRAARVARGLSPEALGRIVGKSGAAIRDIETGATKTQHVATIHALVAEMGERILEEPDHA